MTCENIEKPWGSEKAYRCPCCGYKTLHGRNHNEICQVCFWEDDGQDEHDADIVRGGPNKALSLNQARKNFGVCGAFSQEFAEKVRKPFPDEY